MRRVASARSSVALVSRSTRPLVLAAAVVLAVGCADEPATHAAAAVAAPMLAAGAPATAVPAAGGASSITVGADEYRFATTRCDPSGERPDGVLLRGSGTTQDGRRFTVIAERIQPGDIAFESVTLYFGSIVEGDMWVAERRGPPDGRWPAGAGTDGQDGRDGRDGGSLFHVAGDSLTADGEFRHETSGVVQPGILRARCPR